MLGSSRLSAYQIFAISLFNFFGKSLIWSRAIMKKMLQQKSK